MPKDKTLVSETFMIPEQNFPEFQKRIERLQKRIEKLGFDSSTWLSMDVMNEWFEPSNTHPGLVNKNIEVYVFAQMVKMGNYTFVARLRHDKAVGPMVHVAPGQSLPSKFYTAENTHCDHCKTKRFRKDTFVLRNEEDGEFIQVGRTCIRDFLGHDVEYIAKLAELMSTIKTLNSNYTGSVDGYENYICTEEYMGFVIQVLKHNAWLSKGKAREINMSRNDAAEMAIPTSELAANVFGYVKGWTSHRPEHDATDITDDELVVAQKVIEFWAAKDPSTASSEYEHNCTVIAKSAYINFRDTGFAASMVNSWLREQNKIEEANKLNLDASKHFGNIKDRVQLAFTVLWTKDMDTNWGRSTLTKGITDDGNAVTIWNGNWTAHPQKGDKKTVKGTIKAHDEFKGIKSTVLNRVKEEA